jgi:carboxymethylenebutenolidase
MIEKNEIIKTSDGNMNTFIVHPEGDNQFPLIVFLMDAPGKREELHDMARRIASTGYYVLLPDLYYRFESGFVTDFTEESRKIMFSYMHSLTYSMIISDFECLLNYAKNKSLCNNSLVGTVGYCMSGPFAFRLAAEFNSVIKCSASVHGVSFIC